MHNAAYASRIDDVRRRAHGRWGEILASQHVDERILKRQNLPCPMCGGTDRFQYTDKFGEGNYHCRGCGPGGGFKLLQAVRQIDFPTALEEVERCLGLIPPGSAPENIPESEHRMQELARLIWDEASPLCEGDAVDCYLRGRGLVLQEYPATLRCHPALGFFEKDASGKSRKVAEYTAMLASIQGADGEVVTLHRTYLLQGKKAFARDAKKVLSGGIQGAAVRLFEATHELALTEGIETGIAVHLATGKPVWAGLNAGNLEKLWLPEAVRRVCIYADNDANSDYDGQAFAYALARRLKKEARQAREPRQVEVFVPRQPGADWADVWSARRRALRRTAAC